MCFVMARYLAYLNGLQEKKRVFAGQRGKSKDVSIMSLEQAAAYKAEFRAMSTHEQGLASEIQDLTDIENMHFHYVRGKRGWFRTPPES